MVFHVAPNTVIMLVNILHCYLGQTHETTLKQISMLSFVPNLPLIFINHHGFSGSQKHWTQDRNTICTGTKPQFYTLSHNCGVANPPKGMF